MNTPIGHNKSRVGGVAVDQLKSIIGRVEKLEEERAGIFLCGQAVAGDCPTNLYRSNHHCWKPDMLPLYCFVLNGDEEQELCRQYWQDHPEQVKKLQERERREATKRKKP